MWALDVNVVQVLLDLEGDSISFNNSVTQSSAGHRNRVDSVSQFSANPDAAMSTVGGNPAMRAEVEVAVLKGPERDGKERGVRFIDLGFVQTITFAEWNAVYENGGGARNAVWEDPNKQRLDRITLAVNDGATYNQVAAGAPNTTNNNSASEVNPWYDTGGLTGNAFHDTNADTITTPFTLSVSDTPMLNAFADMPTQGGEALDSINFHWDFELTVAIRTTDGASQRIIPRAQTNWHYDAGGDIAGAGDTATDFGTLTLDGDSGIGGDGFFAPVTSPEPMDIPDGPLANTSFHISGVPFENSSD